MICVECGCEFDPAENPGRCPECGWPFSGDGLSEEDRELERAGYIRDDQERLIEEEDDYPW